VSAGRVLAGRYELGRLLGRGGMAEVYAARDRLLEREVAVKVLRERFREDAAFTARFQDEARHVARLAHPNLVVVHDTGTADGQPFIVMERIHGRTLAQALDAGGLREDRALEVVADVCAALGYAHDRGLVHRDVKPGNVMLGEDGSVKVTDFGIARAVSEDTVTATAAVLGTAAYLSPEQAQGRRVDARSDLYALGVVLYEVLTGQVPFTGETPVAVALQHVRALPTPPRELVPTVSKHAETIALRLLAKDPDRRYQHADDVRLDLERARRSDPPLPLRPPAPKRPATGAGAGTGAGTGTTATGAAATGAGVGPGAGAAGGAAAAAAGAPGPAVDAVGDGTMTRTAGERVRRAAAFLALALAGSAVLVLSVRALTAPPPPEPEVAVPSLVGVGIDVARETLTAADLRTGRVLERQSDAAPGTVIAQDPAPGTALPVGTRVDVTVAVAPTLVTVPSVAGVGQTAAFTRLRDAGLVPVAGAREASDGLPAGTVIRTDPTPGARVERGTTVTVVISTGPTEVRVRDVTARTLDEARARLEEQGLVVEVYEEPNGIVPPGVVIRQAPLAGEPAVAGATVMLWVSAGGGGGGGDAGDAGDAGDDG
jgi:beta-lactam-binding protein with PASTA domain/tRNA A-37 threonylcarbamoyl transferase component Bud32